MKELTGKDLVLRVSGTVQESNLAEFEQTALQVIENINLDLQTDEDFAEAERNVKDCKSVEIRIDNAKNHVINSMEEVAAQNRIIDKLAIKFRETRLHLEKLIKKEKALRKSEIITDAVDVIGKTIDETRVKHGCTIDTAALERAIKGKRSLEKMREAVNEEVLAQQHAIFNLQQLFDDNISIIADAEEKYPGLFPDKKNLALQSEDVVSAHIESRINKFKFDQQQKEEAERKAREAAELKKQQEAEKQSEIADNPFVAPEPPAEPEAPAPPEPQSEVQHKEYRITARVFGEPDKMRSFADSLMRWSFVERVDIDEVEVV